MKLYLKAALALVVVLLAVARRSRQFKDPSVSAGPGVFLVALAALSPLAMSAVGLDSDLWFWASLTSSVLFLLVSGALSE